MIIAAPSDFRTAAREQLPRFLFEYIDGGAFAEQTLAANERDLQAVRLRQRVLADVANVSIATTVLDEPLAIPVILAPVGLTGMYARRGEVQAARAAAAGGTVFTQSTVSVCSIEEVGAASPKPIWFQLYVLKDRGFMKNVLERAAGLGITKLVFTVDMPVPGARYRDARSGMSGPFAVSRRILQSMAKPHWAWNVGVRGRPHDLGNISAYLGKATGLADYIGWLGANFDPGITWSDLDWLRASWTGDILIKGILDVEDARAAQRFGADGLVVSNHGGRQLDGAMSTVRALPAIADAVGDTMTVLADSGVRSGNDVLRMLALGAKAVLIGRAASYALAAEGQAGVTKLLAMLGQELKTSMQLCGVRSIDAINRDILVRSTASAEHALDSLEIGGSVEPVGQ